MRRALVVLLVALAAGALAGAAQAAFFASVRTVQPLTSQRFADWATARMDGGALAVDGASSFGEGLDHVTLVVAGSGGTELERTALAAGQHVDIDPGGAAALVVTLEFPDGSHLRADVPVT